MQLSPLLHSSLRTLGSSRLSALSPQSKDTAEPLLCLHCCPKHSKTEATANNSRCLLIGFEFLKDPCMWLALVHGLEEHYFVFFLWFCGSSWWRMSLVCATPSWPEVEAPSWIRDLVMAEFAKTDSRRQAEQRVGKCWTVGVVPTAAGKWSRKEAFKFK